jgi:outer membrane protein OmpA-like peptidoglycan-associated protein
MNQARIWLVVNPNVGLPLLLGTVLAIALLVHAAILTHTGWMSAYYNGGAKTPVEAAAAEVPVAETPAAEAPAVVAEPAPVVSSAAAPPVGRVFFAVDKSDQWVDGGDSITAMAAYLKANETAKASISGYHDASGGRQHNAELAKARAIVVRDALVARGIAADRLVLEKPVETTGSGDPRDARRVEVTLQP